MNGPGLASPDVPYPIPRSSDSQAQPRRYGGAMACAADCERLLLDTPGIDAVFGSESR